MIYIYIYIHIYIYYDQIFVETPARWKSQSSTQENYFSFSLGVYFCLMGLEESYTGKKQPNLAQYMLIHVTLIHVKTTVKTCQYQGHIYGRSSIFERKSQRVSGFSFPLDQSCAEKNDCYHSKGCVRLLEMHYRIDQPCNIRRITMRGEQSSLRAKRATHVS